MKNIENDESRARNLTVIAREYVRGDPVTRFITNINVAKKRPAFMDAAQRLVDFDNQIKGTWPSKMRISTKRLVYMSEMANTTVINTNFALGSIV